MQKTKTRHFTRLLTAGLTGLLFVGTLMPDSWKKSAEQSVDNSINLAGHSVGSSIHLAQTAVGTSSYLAVAAHVALFAAICYLLPRARWWRVRSWHVLTAGLVLALTTEGLQFFTVDRHPSLAGVVQDLIGTVIGWSLGRGATRQQVPVRPVR